MGEFETEMGEHKLFTQQRVVMRLCPQGGAARQGGDGKSSSAGEEEGMHCVKNTFTLW